MLDADVLAPTGEQKGRSPEQCNEGRMAFEIRAKSFFWINELTLYNSLIGLSKTKWYRR